MSNPILMVNPQAQTPAINHADGLGMIRCLLQHGYSIKRSGDETEYKPSPDIDHLKVYDANGERSYYRALNSKAGRRFELLLPSGWGVVSPVREWNVTVSERDPFSGGYSTVDQHYGAYGGASNKFASGTLFVQHWVSKPDVVMKSKEERFTLSPRTFTSRQFEIHTAMRGTTVVDMSVTDLAVLSAASPVGFIHFNEKGRITDAIADPNSNPWLKLRCYDRKGSRFFILYRDGEYLPLNKSGKAIMTNSESKEIPLTLHDEALIKSLIAKWLS